jgi:uncharacterized protein YqjF (DUF2071 family)
MHPALKQTQHRPWPLPETRWKWRQSWLDLAFIHFRSNADALRTKIPPGLKIQEFGGSAWIGLVPFRMAGVMRRPFPDVPGFSSFPEMNLRTYVEAGGKPGVWFFSLDAASLPVVFGGRRIYGLPYFRARMSHSREGEGINFSSDRLSDEARFVGRYRPIGEPGYPERGTFEHWMAERYCLYATRRDGGLNRVEVHHAPWPVQRAEVSIMENSILAAAGVTADDSEPVCHFSSGVDVVSFPAARVGEAMHP